MCVSLLLFYLEVSSSLVALTGQNANRIRATFASLDVLEGSDEIERG